MAYLRLQSQPACTLYRHSCSYLYIEISETSSRRASTTAQGFACQHNQHRVSRVMEHQQLPSSYPPLFFSCKIHLPYFNLADGVKSTDASLLVEVLVLKHSSKRGNNTTRPDDDEFSGRSSSSDVRLMTESIQQGRREAVSQLGVPWRTTVAVARLDVQTALVPGVSRDGAVSTTSSLEKHVDLKAVTATDSGETTNIAYPKLPDSIPISVKLSFSKPVSNSAGGGDQQAESTMIQRAGQDRDVPSLFVVATTLFDCAKTMKEAELRLYIRCGDTGTVSKLSSGGRGEIGETLLGVAG